MTVEPRLFEKPPEAIVSYFIVIMDEYVSRTSPYAKVSYFIVFGNDWSAYRCGVVILLCLVQKYEHVTTN